MVENTLYRIVGRYAKDNQIIAYELESNDSTKKWEIR